MARRTATSSERSSTPLDPQLIQRIGEMYVTAGWSTRRIATELTVPRTTVSQALHAAGIEVPARGAGRRRPRRQQQLAPKVEKELVALYVEQRLSRAEVASRLGLSESRVRSRLAELKVPTRTRGRGNREDRRRVPNAALEALYVKAELSADAVAMRVGATRGRVLASAHEQGIPVRPGGAVDNSRALETLAALYDDPDVRRVLHRHQVPIVPIPGSITERFPSSVALTTGLISALYQGCGLSTVQIELVTGQPAATVRRRLIKAAVPLRGAGGLAPFTRRARLTAQGQRSRSR